MSENQVTKKCPKCGKTVSIFIFVMFLLFTVTDSTLAAVYRVYNPITKEETQTQLATWTWSNAGNKYVVTFLNPHCFILLADKKQNGLVGGKCIQTHPEFQGAKPVEYNWSETVPNTFFKEVSEIERERAFENYVIYKPWEQTR